jgi:hypothetical protein
MKRALLSGILVIGAAGVVAACGGGDGGEAASGDAPAAGAPASDAPAAAPLGSGTITGTISFTGTPPQNPTIDMAEEPDCKAKHASAPVDPQVVVANGKLANAIVYVKSGLPAGAAVPAATTPVVLDQDGCLYEPRALAVMTGQPIEIRNSDPVLHNIKAVPKVNRGFNVSQPSQGMKTTRSFDKAETMVPLECSVHGWMHANVAVLEHPYHAVSGPDGTFSITGLPAGTYEVEAWHEKLGTRTAQVTVPEAGSATADLSFAASGS